MAPSNSSNFLVIEDPYFEVSKEVRRIKAGAQALSLFGNKGWPTGGRRLVPAKAGAAARRRSSVPPRVSIQCGEGCVGLIPILHHYSRRVLLARHWDAIPRDGYSVIRLGRNTGEPPQKGGGRVTTFHVLQAPGDQKRYPRFSRNTFCCSNYGLTTYLSR